jgi:hypothetical protein
LQKAMKKGMKGGFGDILAHTLSDLLSGVLENAITSMFKKKKKKGGAGDVFGGGGLLGNFLSPLSSLFNFDVASNDRMARHYGYDFANMFTMGMADFKAPQARFAVSSSSRSAPVVHIHMGTNHVREEADIGKIADAVARRVQQQGYGTR